MLTNIDTRKKIDNARKMVAAMTKDGRFIPSTYERMRYRWKMPTPTWATLKKYMEDAGVVAETVVAVWHADGSTLAQMAAPWMEGTEYTYTCYRFV